MVQDSGGGLSSESNSLISGNQTEERDCQSSRVNLLLQMALPLRHQLQSLCSSRSLVRSLATVSSTSPPTNPYTVGPYQIFDRNAKRMQRDRAATTEAGERSRTVDYVRDEVADRMMERLMVESLPRFAIPIH